MKISTRGRYGLRAMIDLAINEEGEAIPLRVIAERENISEQYLEQLFANLRKSGLVKSVRGAHGGYLLNREPENITAGDVFRVLEGPVSPVDCVQEGYECKKSEECVTHDLWTILSDQIEEVLDSHTLEDFKNKAKKIKSN